MKKIVFLGLLASFIVACQQRPTKIYQSRKGPVGISPLARSLGQPLSLSEDVVVVDSRGSFDYSMAHIPGSINIQWQDFTKPRSASPGRLKGDLFKETRRLARMGLHPKSKVIVVGKGLQGQGEEGRVAWTLYYLGIDDVRFVSLDYFNTRLTNVADGENPRVKSVPIWKPYLRSEVMATTREVKLAVTYKAKKKTVIVDVRSNKEYFSKKGLGMGYSLPDLHAINIAWTEFFAEQGRPNMNMRAKLKSIGIKPTDRLIVLSNRGVRSAAVAMALQSLGYSDAANYPGGYRELMASGQQWQ